MTVDRQGRRKKYRNEFPVGKRNCIGSYLKIIPRLFIWLNIRFSIIINYITKVHVDLLTNII